MSNREVGKIRFISREGQLFLGQHFNPSDLDREQRRQVAESLNEIAANIENDRFAVDGEYVKFPVSAAE